MPSSKVFLAPRKTNDESGCSELFKVFIRKENVLTRQLSTGKSNYERTDDTQNLASGSTVVGIEYGCSVRTGIYGYGDGSERCCDTARPNHRILNDRVGPHGAVTTASMTRITVHTYFDAANLNLPGDDRIMNTAAPVNGARLRRFVVGGSL